MKMETESDNKRIDRTRSRGAWCAPVIRAFKSIMSSYYLDMNTADL